MLLSQQLTNCGVSSAIIQTGTAANIKNASDWYGIRGLRPCFGNYAQS